MKTSKCPFCRGSRTYAYRMNGRSLHRCEECNTIGLEETPTAKEISEFYQGFQFQTQAKNYHKIKTPQIREWMSRYVSKRPSRMLDIGGGGGFFARAFEDFGFGESTVVDLDKDACEFARSEMNLSRVYNESVESFLESTNERYDFIYCRHVIEHLVDPVGFIKACTGLLAIGGVFVVQCPNGSSKEVAFVDPKRWKYFLVPIHKENKWHKFYSILFSLGPCYGFGIDPIRHLWAITGRGLEAVFSDNSQYVVELSSASLTDPVFSPYFPADTKLERLQSNVARRFFGPLLQGAHLIAEIKRLE